MEANCRCVCVCVRVSVCLPLGVYSLGAQEVSHLLLPTESLMLGQPPFKQTEDFSLFYFTSALTATQSSNDYE